ncbi:hypothetical protein [Paraburkholderia graminis]
MKRNDIHVCGRKQRVCRIDPVQRRAIHPQIAVVLLQTGHAGFFRVTDSSGAARRDSQGLTYAKMALPLAQRALTSNAWRVAEPIGYRHYCAGCDGGCMHQALACKQWLQRAVGKGNREETWTCVDDGGAYADCFWGRHIFGNVEST